MNTMMTLLRRELWESPVAFKWTPIGIGLLLLLVLALTLLFVREVDNQSGFTMEVLRWVSETDPQARREYLSAGFLGLASFFNMIMFVIIVFYLAHSLYDDRKDRSILFWKSLPVSDTQTVLSKLITATLMIPLCFLLAIAATWIGIMAIATVYGLAAGINPITAFWLPALDPHTWVLQIAAYLVMALWLLPIYGWLLFCSAWAPRLPILIAIGIPLLLGLFQNFYSWISNFRFPDVNIWVQFFGRLGDGLSGMTTDSFNFTIEAGFTSSMLLSFGALADRLTSLSLWIGVVVGIALIVAAVWFRRRATDN